MTKGEILAALTNSGEDKVFRESENWRKALVLYKEAHPGTHKNLHCGSCYREILAWLKQ